MNFNTDDLLPPRVIPSFYTDIDYDAVELRPNFSLGPTSNTGSCDGKMCDVDDSMSPPVPCIDGETYVEDDERTFIDPPISPPIVKEDDDDNSSSLTCFWEMDEDSS